MPTGTTVGGWAILLTLAGTFYWATNQRKNKNRRLTDAKQSRAQESKSEKTRKRKDTGQSSGDQSIKPAQKSPAKPQKKKTEVKHVEEPKAIATGRTLNDSDGDDKVDDKAFAQAMSNAKAGKVGVSQTQATAKPKSVKQKRAHEKPENPEVQSDELKAPSSTGGDADDDQSLINSPEFGATSLAEPVASGGVADMLEKPAGGPSVLKINAPTNPAPLKQSKPRAEFESVETKKQRQNRKKAEEKKAVREAEEAERRVLLERQRRTAREAEGRAAKDGTSFMASQAPSKSAWTAPPEVNGTGDNTAAKSIELLDTYEPTNGKVTTKPAEIIHSQSQEHRSEYAHLTEDQQLRKAKEESVAWEIVKAKKGKNKSASKGGSGEGGSGSEDHEYGVPQPAPEKTQPGKTWVMNTTHVNEDMNVVEREVELQDSEWEVA